MASGPAKGYTDATTKPEGPNRFMRLLFITANRIGDAVLSTGILGHIVERHPHAEVTVAAGPAAAPLFGAVPGLKRVAIVRKARFGLHWLKLWRAVAGTHWDWAVDLRRSALVYTVRADRRSVLPHGGHRRHRVVELAETVGLGAAPPAPRLWWRGAHDEAAARLIPAGGPVLAIGPTANWPGKVWPAARFVETVAALTAPGAALAGARVAVFGGPDERLQANPVLREIPAERRIDLVGKIDLPTAAACLARCRLYLGNDSGLMHMAAAVGIPTLGLFGPSPETLYAPWGPHTAHVRTRESFDDILSAPGYDHLAARSWMGGLETAAVIEAAEALIARTREAA